MMVALLRIPVKFNSTEVVLETAKKMDLSNILLLSEKEDGSIVFLSTDMTLASTNWLLDRMKVLLLMPEMFQKVG